MQSAPWKKCVVCGLTVLALTGCASYSPYGNGMGGHYGYPGGVYATPPAGYAPQPGVQLGVPTPMVVPGVPAYGAEIPPENGSALSAPDPAGARASQSDAPLYTPPQKAAAPTSSDNNRVPNPINIPETEEKVTPFQFGNDATEETEVPFGSQGALAPTNEPPKLAAMETAPKPITKDGTGSFVEPIPVEMDEGRAALVSAEEKSGKPNPYDYDRESYEWLRGKVDYDEKDQTWNIIFSLTPDQKDRFGGSITLVDHPDLSKLKNDDVIFLEGRIDPDALDRSEKPKYRIDKLIGPLVPIREVSNPLEE